MARQTMRPHKDARFDHLGIQPRGKRLDRKQRAAAYGNQDFAEALRLRMSNPPRFEAFMDGKTTYRAIDKPCPKCGGVRRVVRDTCCHACVLASRAEGFAALKRIRKQKQEAAQGIGTARPEPEVPIRNLYDELFSGNAPGKA